MLVDYTGVSPYFYLSVPQGGSALVSRQVRDDFSIKPISTYFWYVVLISYRSFSNWLSIMAVPLFMRIDRGVPSYLRMSPIISENETPKGPASTIICEYLQRSWPSTPILSGGWLSSMAMSQSPRHFWLVTRLIRLILPSLISRSVVMNLSLYYLKAKFSGRKAEA